MAAKNSGVASGNGLPASVPEQHASRIPSSRHVDGRLRQQNDVAAVEIDVLVGRVEPRRLAADRPVGRRKHVAHVELQLDDRFHDARERRRREQPRRAFAALRPPRRTRPRRRVRTDGSARCARVGEQHGAVEPAREEDGDIIHESARYQYYRRTIDDHVSCHQADRVLLRSPAARLRRRLQASARAQRVGGDRSPHRPARHPQHGRRLQRHQAGRERAGSIASWITR